MNQFATRKPVNPAKITGVSRDRCQVIDRGQGGNLRVGIARRLAGLAESVPLSCLPLSGARIKVVSYVRNTNIQGIGMAISVRLDPALEAAMDAEARRLGITKTALVKDSLERRLGLKNPAELLRTVRSGTPMGDPSASEQVSARMKAKLRAQRPA